MTRSHFTFTFRISPREHCLHLNFQNIEFATGFKAVCIRDYLGIVWTGDPVHNETAREIARSMARTLVQSHAYFSFPNGPVLEIEPETWLEIRNCDAEEAVYGNMHPSLATSPLQEGHEDNTAFLRAANIVGPLGPHFSLQVALGDFRVARRDLGPYSSFYAYRVLENIGYAFGITKEDKPEWDAMNKALGTDKGKWQPLTDAGTWARHLNEQSFSKLAAANRQQLLGLSHEALSLAFGYFQISQP